jgi:hypothetical protein
MSAPEWLHACGPRVYLFDWFEYISAGYRASGLRPPLQHFLRHSSYFQSPGAAHRTKRPKTERPEVDAELLSCALHVWRAVSDEWHRPPLSWLVAPPRDGSPDCSWPQIVGSFDSAAALDSGAWQPLLQTTMENACEECSVIAVGGDEFVMPPRSAFRKDAACPARSTAADAHQDRQLGLARSE